MIRGSSLTRSQNTTMYFPVDVQPNRPGRPDVRLGIIGRFSSNMTSSTSSGVRPCSPTWAVLPSGSSASSQMKVTTAASAQLDFNVKRSGTQYSLRPADGLDRHRRPLGRLVHLRLPPLQQRPDLRVEFRAPVVVRVR